MNSPFASLALKLPAHYPSLDQGMRRKVREQYVLNQKGKCHHCKEPLKGPPSRDMRELPLCLTLFPQGFLNHSIHLHHDHKTGMTIGAVHAKCNGVLWQYHNE